MRLLYLCAVDPPPPQSDGSAVRNFFETLPEYLYPASSDRDSPHKLFFADRVGRGVIMEFFDFAVVFLSKNFLNSENAMACLARAKTAFPNMVCIDLHNNLTAEETSIAVRYSKHILSLEEGRQFLISTFPEIGSIFRGIREADPSIVCPERFIPKIEFINPNQPSRMNGIDRLYNYFSIDYCGCRGEDLIYTPSKRRCVLGLLV